MKTTKTGGVANTTANRLRPRRPPKRDATLNDDKHHPTSAPSGRKPLTVPEQTGQRGRLKNGTGQDDGTPAHQSTSHQFIIFRT